MDDDEDKAELQREMNETERKIAELEVARLPFCLENKYS
jgi:hypothetical protein